MEDVFYTADELAAVLKVTRRAVLKWVQQGRVPRPRKFGKSARWPARDVQHLITEGIPAAGRVTKLVTCPRCRAVLTVDRQTFQVVAHRGELPEVDQAEAPAKRKPGRPKGSKNKVPRHR